MVAPTATREAIEQMVLEVFTEQGACADRIDPTALLSLIGIDSLGIAEVAVVMNDKFDLEIGLYDLEGVTSLQTLLAVVFDKAGC